MRLLRHSHLSCILNSGSNEYRHASVGSVEIIEDHRKGLGGYGKSLIGFESGNLGTAGSGWGIVRDDYKIQTPFHRSTRTGFVTSLIF
jgi:hypothetical protein